MPKAKTHELFSVFQLCPELLRVKKYHHMTYRAGLFAFVCIILLRSRRSSRLGRSRRVKVLESKHSVQSSIPGASSSWNSVNNHIAQDVVRTLIKATGMTTAICVKRTIPLFNVPTTRIVHLHNPRHIYEIYINLPCVKENDRATYLSRYPFVQLRSISAVHSLFINVSFILLVLLAARPQDTAHHVDNDHSHWKVVPLCYDFTLQDECSNICHAHSNVSPDPHNKQPARRLPTDPAAGKQFPTTSFISERLHPSLLAGK